MSKNEYLNKKRKKEENDEKENKEEKNKEKIEKIKYNIIIGIIKVEKNNLKQRIINSYENTKFKKLNFCEGIENEKEIKECEIIYK